MTKANMMKEAHRRAKNYEGEYIACLALALEELHREEKEMTVKEKLVQTGLKVWTKTNSKGKIIAERVYINDIEKAMNDFNRKGNNKAYRRGCQAYYDCLEDSFNYDCTRSAEAAMKELFSLIRTA